MRRKLIIDGNAVYEIDEDCMLKKRLDVNGEKDLKKYENKNGERKGTTKYKKAVSYTHLDVYKRQTNMCNK